MGVNHVHTATPPLLSDAAGDFFFLFFCTGARASVYLEEQMEKAMNFDKNLICCNCVLLQCQKQTPASLDFFTSFVVATR